MMLFSLAVLAMLWLMQVVFINGFYQSMKTQGIKTAAGKIATLYTQVQGQAFEVGLDAIANQRDLFVIIMDREGRSVLYAKNPENRDYRTPLERLDRPPGLPGPQNLRGSIFEQFASVVRAAGSAEVTHSFEDRRGSAMLLYGNLIADSAGNQALLVISSPLQPLDDTVRILRAQLVYVTLAVLALALVVSVVIALRVSRPLTRITGKAALLARGRYDMAFDRGGYTEVDQLADTLNYVTAELGQVESLRRELIANVSHDLRTPLTMIKLYAEMIRDLNGDNRTKREQNVAVIIEESDRLTALVQNLLDLSRLQSGTLPFHAEAFDLVELVESILTRYDALVQQQGYRFLFEHPDQLWVRADRARIEQVLYNLINNAVNHAGADKQVALKAAGYRDSVLLSVTDNGEGIAQEDLERIWDRYYKVDREHRRDVAGTGLGLSIVKSILDQHHAKYGVRSQKGAGATFWFELQRDASDDIGQD